MLTNSGVGIIRGDGDPDNEEHTCANDFICILKGARKPYRLRQIGGGYIMMGQVDWFRFAEKTHWRWQDQDAEVFVLLWLVGKLANLLS